VGQVADLVKDEVERLTGKRVKVDIKDKQDFRNYKVSCDKARTCLGFKPKYDVPEMISSIYQRLEQYGDFSNPNFYNIQVFKSLEATK
jgi:nucleoside-diphosphate-sugar epimerase